MSAEIKAIGQRVVVRDAAGALHPAVVSQVPPDWRDQSRSVLKTFEGAFPKAWVRVGTDRNAMPWPLDAIYDPCALPAKSAVVAAGASERPTT